MSVVLGRHFEKQDEQSALRSRIDIDNDCELIIDANAHVSGAVKLGQWNNLNADGIDSTFVDSTAFSASTAHAVFDQSVVSASITPAFGGYAGTRHDMSPDYLFGDTYPTFVTGTNGSSSYWEFDGINNALVTDGVSGYSGARISSADLGDPANRNHFATSVNIWVRDSGTKLSNIVDGGTGSNQAYSKIWSVEDDHIALEENHTSVTLALSGRLNSGYGSNVSHTDFRPSMTGSSEYTSAVIMSGSTQPGSVFMWAGTTETATGSLGTGVHSKKYALLVPKVTYGMGTDNTGTYNAGTFSQSLHTFSNYSLSHLPPLEAIPNLSAPSGSVTRGGAASLYEHLGSPVSGSKIVCIDHTRPNNVYEFTVKEVGDTSGTPAAGFPAETDKYLVMDETCLCNGVSTPISGSANSPHGSGAFQGVAQGDGRLLTVKLAGNSDKVKFYQNGHNQIVQNSTDHTLKQSDGWVNYCVVIKADNNYSGAGQVTKVYKNGELVQKLEGVGRFIGDRSTSSVSGDGTPRKFYIGRSSTSNKSYWKGKVAFCAVYIKELEPGEVMGNYYALKDRYIGK